MPKQNRPIEVVELFAGVGGFRLGLEGHPDPKWNMPGCGFKVVWANQWEPPGSPGRQFAFDCYRQRFDPFDDNPDEHSNEDIARVLDDVEAGRRIVPGHQMLVGGFPCQDYSVAKPLSMAEGIHGKKGVLWWEIHRMLELAGDGGPRYLLLENVDRMLKSPAGQRGRDFAVILSCLQRLGYSVEWRVINAADYGFPQRRRRIFIYGEKTQKRWNLKNRLLSNGVLSTALPAVGGGSFNEFSISNDPFTTSETFGTGCKVSAFANSGVMQAGKVLTCSLAADYSGPYLTLADVVLPEEQVSPQFFIAPDKVDRWKYYKGSKSEPRTDKNGYEYRYSEGSMAFPDPLDRPSRTILTGEGGQSASRFKHVIATDSGQLRRLTADELEILNGFPRGWTATGMSDGNRAFCMGNALVIGVVQLIGKEIARRARRP